MKQKRYNKFALGIAMTCTILMVACISCVSDLGNYSYHDINEVEIKLDPLYEVAHGNEFTIIPEIKFSIPNDDEFEYSWHILDGRSDTLESIGILGRERDLHVPDGPWILKPVGSDRAPIWSDTIRQGGTYRMLYCVTNKQTGVRYDKPFSVNSEYQTTNGYIMLCEDGEDSFNIELISIFQGKLTQYNDVLDVFESTLSRKGRKPIDLLCYADLNSPVLYNSAPGFYNYAVWILTDQSTDQVRVEDFAYSPDYNIKRRIALMDRAYKPANGRLVATRIISNATNDIRNSYGGSYEYLLYNGNFFFSGSGLGFPVNYTFPINRTGLPIASQPYKVAPDILVAPYGAILFNETNNRFELFHATASLQMQSAYEGLDIAYTQRMNAGDNFDWENPAYRLVYMGTRTHSGQTSYAVVDGFAIVENTNANQYELLQMTLSGVPTIEVTQNLKTVFQAFPGGITPRDIKHYAFATAPMPYLYMATEDKVYRVNSTIMDVPEDVTAQLVPAGHKISKMKYTGASPRFPRTDLIAIATYDPNGESGENGMLAFYSIQDGTGDLVLAKHPEQPAEDGYQIEMKWTGFGKVINVDYKAPTKRGE